MVNETKRNSTAGKPSLLTCPDCGGTLSEFEDGLYAVVGSPATVRDRMREVLKQTGCGIVQGIFQVGSMPHELAQKNMTLFAREVMPALRAEFP